MIAPRTSKRSVENDPRRTASLPPSSASLAQAADDVLDVDDRIIDDVAQGDHQPGRIIVLIVVPM